VKRSAGLGTINIRYKLSNTLHYTHTYRHFTHTHTLGMRIGPVHDTGLSAVLWSSIPATASIVAPQEQNRTGHHRLIGLCHLHTRPPTKIGKGSGKPSLVVLQQNYYLSINVSVKMKYTKTTSIVTTIELSPPPRWLVTTEPTPPSRCFTVCLAVFRALFPENFPSLWQRHLIPA